MSAGTPQRGVPAAGGAAPPAPPARRSPGGGGLLALMAGLAAVTWLLLRDHPGTAPPPARPGPDVTAPAMPASVPVAGAGAPAVSADSEVAPLPVSPPREAAAPAAIDLSVVVLGLDRLPAPVLVDLLYDRGGAPPAATSLVVDRQGKAALALGAGARPRWLDFGFPTAGGSVLSAETALGSWAARLLLPPCGQIAVAIVEDDGAPPDEPVHAQVRSPSSAPPADRWLRLAVDRGHACCRAEATGRSLQLRVETASGRTAEHWLNAPSAAGQQVDCTITLPAPEGSRRNNR